MNLIKIETIGQNFLQLSFNNPDTLNALSEAMAEEFQMQIKELVNSDKKYRALIIRGSGAAFSAGGDLQMLLAKADRPSQKNREDMLKFYNSFLCILDLPFPVIAALNGTAVGAGLILACACDLRIAASGAKLGFGFIKLGLHPGMGASYFVPRLIGPAKTAELFLASNIFSAQYASEIGLVNKILPSETFDFDLEVAIQEIFGNAPEASAQLVKTLRPTRADLKPYLDHEAFCQSVNYSSAEFKEGVSAMIAKRKPNY